MSESLLVFVIDILLGMSVHLFYKLHLKLMYIHIACGRSFMSAASEVAMTKPIIVIKPGRTEQAAAAAASHTGSLTGSDDVLVRTY